MSDVMLFGVLRMPLDMAMSDELSRYQYWQRGQEAADRVEQLEQRESELVQQGSELNDEINRMRNEHARQVEQLESQNAELREALEGLYSHTKNNHNIAGLNTKARAALSAADAEHSLQKGCTTCGYQCDRGELLQCGQGHKLWQPIDAALSAANKGDGI